MLIAKHRGPLASDFRRYYGLSLADIRHSGIPLFEVADLAANLPPGSAIERAINPQWWYSPEVGLLQNIEWQIRRGNWMQTQDGANGVNAPEPIDLLDAPTDAQPAPGPDVMSTADMAARMGWSETGDRL